VTAFCGPDKCGKSTTLTAGCVALATGQPFLGEPVTPGVALWLKLEEHTGDLLPRVHAMGNPGDRLVVFEQRPTLADVEREIVKHKAAVVVFDTLIEWAGDRVTDAGQAAQWAPVMRELRTLAQKHNVAVVLLHHARKSDGKAADSRHITAQSDVILECLKLPKDTTSGCQEITVRGRWVVSDFAVRLVDGKRCELAGGAPAVSIAKASREERKMLMVLTPGMAYAEWEQAYGGKKDTFKSGVKRLKLKALVHQDDTTGVYSPNQLAITEELAT
jgi:hypothetical protein